MTANKRFLAGIVVLLSFASLGARSPHHAAKPRAGRLTPTAFVTTDLTQGVTPQDLVTTLLGPGVTASNVIYTGANVAAGSFLGGTGIIEFDAGIILGSGCVSGVVGPNVSDSFSCDNFGAGDADLSVLSGFDTFDATVLEFDFVPSDPNGTTLLFSYVFSSDEYNEWVYTPYNDVFAFYVNGQNCALVPAPGGTQDPVTINTVNGGNPYGSGNAANPVLYRNNSLADGGGLIDTEMDGLTVVLTCQAAITPNATNHVKLAIADASDGVYDSNVMIRAASLTPTDLVITLAPPSATNPVGTTHTVTATIVNNQGVPQGGNEVFFSVISGPNAGATGICTSHANCETDDFGIVSFTYTGGPTAGTDVIRGCFEDAGGNFNCAPAVTKTWVLPCSPDGSPCGDPPAECEVQDTCLNAICHDNGFLPAATECRPVAVACDTPEFCTGADPTCPLDQHAPDGTTCDDLDPCTTLDSCTAGACAGAPVGPPAEVDDGLSIEQRAGGAVVGWHLANGATSSDLLRGLTSALPVGPGGGDEACFGNLPGTTFTDATLPVPGSTFWYLVRGVNTCAGAGTYGFQGHNGVPGPARVSGTCP